MEFTGVSGTSIDQDLLDEEARTRWYWKRMIKAVCGRRWQSLACRLLEGVDNLALHSFGLRKEDVPL